MPTKCFVCNGAGQDYSWADRDPIEGYKMARQHTCLFCDGRGSIPDDDRRMVGVRAYLDAMGDAELVRVTERERREAERAKLVASAKNKLTSDELSALGVDD